MEILLQDLLPGQEYLLQLRSKNQQGVSQWSRAYSITTDSDVIAPSPVTGLTWDVSGTSFVGSWTPPTTDSDGDPLRDFRDFKVTITGDSTDVIFYVSEPRFDLSLSRNTSAFGSPEPSVDIKVEVRDTIGNLSTPSTDSASNPIPADVTGFDATSALGGINLIWNHVSDTDIKQYEIYASGSSGFTPGPSNLKIVTSANSAFYATDILTLQYFKIRAVDVFDQGSANYTLESGLAYPLDGVPDSTAPSQPSAPTISLGTLVAQVSHDMTKQGGGNLESDVDYLEIHASASTGFTPSSSTLRGTIDSAGIGIAISAAFFFPTTDSMTNLYWKVIAVDRSKNKSIASNQTTGLPGLIQNVNILNATITDAKVQNLSAAKLIAGTAIVNDLFIESALTVSDTGYLESEDFVTGVSGWKIDADGSVEFNDGTFRGDVLIESGGTTMLLSINSNGVPAIEMDGPDGGALNIALDLIDNPYIELKAASGDLYEIMARNNEFGFSINFTNLSGEPSLHITNDYGIFLRSATTQKSVIFDEATGYLKAGFNATTMYNWTTLPGNNSWTGGFYKLFPDGMVRLEGNLSGGTQTDGIVVATLPSGFRPARAHEFIIGRSGAYGSGKVTIGTNGVINFWTNDAVWNGYLSGISFSVLS